MTAAGVQQAGDPGAARLLLASIHDVGPRFEREVDRLAELYLRVIGAPRFAMLVVPDHWGDAPLAENRAFQRRLRDWADQGVEMFVHGWYHRDTSEHGGMAGFKARHMTAGEGEFLGLDQVEAARRMAAGKALVEDVIGRPAAGFIAPAWLYGPGTLAALQASGFALAEDHFRVWRADNGEVLTRGPVITWASRSRARQLSSLAVAAAGRVALGLQRVVRVATHPGDTTVPALMTSIERTLTRFVQGRQPSTYAALAARSGAAHG